MCWLIAVAGLLLLRALLPKLLPDRFTRNMILAAYLLLAAASFKLYFISSLRMPFGTAYQLGGGLWSFAWDAAVYDKYARAWLALWTQGSPLIPEWRTEWPMVLYTGLIYRLFGPHPLHAVLLNGVYTAVSGLLAYRIAARLTPSLAHARLAAALVLFWPSLFLWSTQLLKEPLCLMLILLAFDRLFAEQRRGTAWQAAVPLFLLSVLRGYTGIALAAAILAAFLIRLPFRDRAWRFGLVAGLLLAVGAGAWLSSPETVSAILPGGGDPRIPRYMGMLRSGIANQAGGSLIDPQVKINTSADAVKYLPRGMAIAFFAPFPWRWLGTAGMRTIQAVAGMESLLILLAAPLLGLLGLRLGRVLGSSPVTAMLLYSLLLAACLAISVPNVGTLFRLRLQFLLPLLVLTAALLGPAKNSQVPENPRF